MVALSDASGGSDAVLRMQFDTAIAKLLVAQADQLRVLGDSLRDESTAMLHKLQDQVCSQVSSSSKATASPPAKSGLHAMIDELFARNEVQRGLVEWLGDKAARQRAENLLTELQVDISTGEGNDARTTLNKLLPLYMEALNVREIGEHTVPAASPSGDKKLLGNLILGSMQPFLEQLRMMYLDAVNDGESYAAGKSDDFKETTKRLKTALIVFLNTGNYASHNRGKLSFCQQIELCGAVGAMAETLPVVFEACQVVKLTRTGKTSPTRKRANSPCRGTVLLSPPLPKESTKLPMDLKIGEESGASQGSEGNVEGFEQLNIAAYYREYLIESARAKYEDTLTHMEMVPKARLCVMGMSCNREDCSESHSMLQALSFNPLVVTLKCPVPQSFWHDFVHENKLCLLNHGELKTTPTFRMGKKILCWDGADCKNAACLRSHSLAEVCWFNPSFRTEDCVQGKECPWKQTCCAFHKEYHGTKRSIGRNEYAGVAEPMLFPMRTLKAMKKVPLPSPSRSKLVPKTTPNLGDQIQVSSSDQKKYTRVLNHMQMVPKARVCTNEEHYKQDSNTEVCEESHDIIEALSFNPLAMVLTCPTPKNSRDNFVHRNGLCVFHHGDKPVPKEFRKTKNLLCELRENCADETCTKSHSIVEICWFFPIFRVNKCPQGDSCKRQQTCSLYHSECHEKRDSSMNNTVGNPESVLFISRAYAELVSKTPSVQNLEVADDESVTSGEVDAEVISNCDSYVSRSEDALMKRTEAKRVKYMYDHVLEHMKLVPKARLCTKCEDHDEVCAESHSRMEALEYNPLAMILKCPIDGDSQGEEHQTQCVFDHDKGPIPKGFLKDKKLLCEDFDACSNSNCVKSHSFAEVCWFNPQFRVADCPQGSECPRKQTCVGFHSEHSGRRNMRMNSQVGTTERTVFVKRVSAALTKRRLQALSHTHPNLVAEPTIVSPETFQDDEAAEMENTSEAGNENAGEPNCKLS